MSESTVRNGVFELEAGGDPLTDGCIRRPGGGRKPAEEQDPSLIPALLKLVEPDERGDPMSPLRWTTKYLRNLAEELPRQGHPVSAPTVGRLLKGQGFSLIPARARTAMARPRSLSLGNGRWACMSVRRMFARTRASPGSDFLRETECRSR